MKSSSKCTWEECVREELTGIASKNVISALVRAFVHCYPRFEKCGGREKVSYVTGFSREASVKLYEEFRCSKVKELMDAAERYLRSLANIMRDSFDAVFLIKATLLSRLTVSTRNPALPLEISISWDPVLNLPYIPSSSIKGLVRAYLATSCGAELGESLVNEVFGSQERSGLVVFTDAYPVECSGESLVEPDVLTPHYSEVRRAIDEASSSPTPLVFPTIARGVTLAMVVAFRCDRGSSSALDCAKVLKLSEKIGEALEQGIGARTSIGYGRARVSLESPSKQAETQSRKLGSGPRSGSAAFTKPAG